MMSVVASCQRENVEFKLAGNNLDFVVGKTSVSVLEDIPLIEINYNISNPQHRFFKTVFDYVFGALVLFFIYPFIYLTGLQSKKQSDFKKFILKTPKIFSGRFSFVGPQNAAELNNLYLGKTGLTGLWYIESREGTNYEKLNIFYAKNQSIWLDLEIIGKTLIKMWVS